VKLKFVPGNVQPIIVVAGFAKISGELVKPEVLATPPTVKLESSFSKFPKKILAGLISTMLTAQSPIRVGLAIPSLAKAISYSKPNPFTTGFCLPGQCSFARNASLFLLVFTIYMQVV